MDRVVRLGQVDLVYQDIHNLPLALGLRLDQVDLVFLWDLAIPYPPSLPVDQVVRMGQVDLVDQVYQVGPLCFFLVDLEDQDLHQLQEFLACQAHLVLHHLQVDQVDPVDLVYHNHMDLCLPFHQEDQLHIYQQDLMQ